MLLTRWQILVKSDNKSDVTHLGFLFFFCMFMFQSLSKTNASSSSAKCGDGSSSDKHNTAWWHTKTYPIRSRIRNADMVSSDLVFHNT